jgi:hypothetical protein
VIETSADERLATIRRAWSSKVPVAVRLNTDTPIVSTPIVTLGVSPLDAVEETGVGVQSFDSG